ncbi:MAG: cytochrome c3 family protein [Desulfobia sp.]
MRKKIDLRKMAIAAGLAGAVSLLPQSLLAAVSGPCVDCHTMHNMQDGNVVDSDGPNKALTNDGCLGCHTGTTAAGMTAPYVFDTVEPTYTNSPDGTGGGTLAGGNFYWVENLDDTRGHNVVELPTAGDDSNIGNTPPGWSIDFDANRSVDGGTDNWTENQLSCAGVYGCHGGDEADPFTAISGAHHGDDSTMDGSTTAQSFRFLLGITGVEDSDWEFNATASDHNQYYGVDRTSDATLASTGDEEATTISYYCAECHGNYHSGTGDLGADDAEFGSAWLRHPTDFDMGSATGTEYADYGGASNTYQLRTPVASDQTDNPGVVQSTVFDGTDDAIVTCISCHRAHGSPHADLLRWDYGTCEAGTDNADCGCFDCHTTKDAS